MLPSDTPQPLEVRAGGRAHAQASGSGSGTANPNGASTVGVMGASDPSNERMMERGVKVKWPAKRMSVLDMNKRVRALVEWVGREQASALDRGRRREALEGALKDQDSLNKVSVAESNRRAENDDVEMLDGANHLGANPEDAEEEETLRAKAAEFVSSEASITALEMSAQTMKMMEELMEELIGFQERFGPSAPKLRERERRVAAAA